MAALRFIIKLGAIIQFFMLLRLKTFLFGQPLGTYQVSQERLSNSQGLAIFSSDALSSTAYATEEILWVLALAGAGALFFSIPITIAIVILILVVALSYRQTIHAYPQGGGAYTVAKENLGELPGLVAAASLLVDYILTAAVSVSAGVAALTSAYPTLYPWRVALGVLTLILLAWGNLRGVRESGKIFTIPTYLFIASLFWLLGHGLWQFFHGTLPIIAPHPTTLIGAGSSIGLLLILRAFSSGCTAMTGLEATSNGVQAFRPPEAKNAANTMTVMALVLGTIFIGISFLAYHLHAAPRVDETIISQVARSLFGNSFSYFLIQIATALILLLAANTPFADFPRVSAVLAKDKFFPHQFRQLGGRLIYSNGIVFLTFASLVLIVFFHADTHRLIPLYAVGVFLGFTLSQWGMVRHWKRIHPQVDHKRHRFNIFINAFGGTLTALVLVITFFAKFAHGAWILVPAIFALVLFMRSIRAHYNSIAEQLSLQNPAPPLPKEKTVILLVAGVHQGTMKAVEVARGLQPNHLKAVHIALDEEEAAKVKKKWKQYVPDITLDVISSPFRDLISPLIQYTDKAEKQWENDTVIVVMPEFIPTKFWHHFLHNQTAIQIRWALEHRENVEILDVPYRLQEKQTLELGNVLWVGFVAIVKEGVRLIKKIRTVLLPRKKE